MGWQDAPIVQPAGGESPGSVAPGSSWRDAPEVRPEGEDADRLNRYFAIKYSPANAMNGVAIHPNGQRFELDSGERLVAALEYQRDRPTNPGKYIVNRLPFGAGAAWQTADAANVITAMHRIADDKADGNDYLVASEFLTDQVRAKDKADKRGQLDGYEIGMAGLDIASHLPATAVDFLASGPMALIGKKLAGKAAFEGVKRALGKIGYKKAFESLAGRAAIKGTVGAAEAVGATATQMVAPTILPSAVPKAVGRMQPKGVEFVENDEGRLQAIIPEKMQGDTIWQALPKGIGDHFTEVLSERAGAMLPGLPKGAAAKWLPESVRGVYARAVGSRLMRALADGDQGLMKAIKGAQGAIGFHGIGGEVLEERLKEGLDYGLGISDDAGALGQLAGGNLSAAGGQIGSEVLGFAPFGAGGKALGVAGKYMPKEVREALRTSLDQLGTQPTRKAWAAQGLPAEVNEKGRAEYVARVKKLVDEYEAAAVQFAAHPVGAGFSPGQVEPPSQEAERAALEAPPTADLRVSDAGIPLDTDPNLPPQTAQPADAGAPSRYAGLPSSQLDQIAKMRRIPGWNKLWSPARKVATLEATAKAPAPLAASPAATAVQPSEPVAAPQRAAEKPSEPITPPAEAPQRSTTGLPPEVEALDDDARRQLFEAMGAGKPPKDPGKFGVAFRNLFAKPQVSPAQAKLQALAKRPPPVPPPVQEVVAPPAEQPKRLEPTAAKITPDTWRKTFKGATVREVDGEHHIDLPNGHTLKAVYKGRGIPFTDADWARLEVVEGRKFTPEEKATWIGYAKVQFEMEDGTQFNLPRAIWWTDHSTEATAVHEAVHVAAPHGLGLFSKPLWKALVEEYSDPAAPESKQEEDIAKAAEKWGTDSSLPQLIKATIKTWLEKVGLAKLTAADAVAIFKSEGFWSRPTKAQTAKPQRQPSLVEGEPDRVNRPAATRQPQERQPAMFSGLDRPPGTQELPGFESIDKIDKSLADEESSRKTYAWEPDARKSFVEEELATRNERAREEGDALHQITSQFGVDLKALRLKVWGIDNRGGDYDQIPHFDEMVEYAQRKYPQLLRGTDPSQALFERLKTGARTFTKNSPEIVEAVNARMKQARADHAQYLADKAEREAHGGGPAHSQPQDDTPFQIGPARPDLSQISPSVPVREQIVSPADAARNAAGQPQPVADAQVTAQRDQRLAANYAGERAHFLDVAAKGGQLDKVETSIAKEIIHREGEAALAAQSVDEMYKAQQLVDAYRKTGNVQASAFRQRFDPIKQMTRKERNIDAIVTGMLTPSDETQAAIDKAEGRGTAAGNAEAEELRRKFAADMLALKEQLKGKGVDLDSLATWGYDPIKAQAAIKEIAIAKRTWRKATYEFWRAGLLSGAASNQRNAIGNTGSTIWHFLGERPLEAFANEFKPQADGVRLSDLKEMFQHLLPAAAEGAKLALMTWRTEFSAFDEKYGASGDTFGKIGESGHQIPGFVGRLVRSGYIGIGGQNMMLAVDDFYHGLNARAEVVIQANIEARQLGIPAGQPTRSFVAEQVRNIESDAWKKAIEVAHELTSTQRGNKVTEQVKGIVAAAKKVPYLGVAADYLIPFTNFAINNLHRGIKLTPAGGVTLAVKMRQNYKNGRPVMEGLGSHAASQVVMSMLLLALLANDPDDPWVTGAKDENDPKRREQMKRGALPPSQSVKIAGRWWSYRDVEPFATALAPMVDFTMGMRRGDPLEATENLYGSAVGMVRTKSFLRGIGDLFQIVDAEKGIDGALDWASGFAASWVPNIARATARGLKPNVPDRRIQGKGLAERGFKTLQRTIEKTEVPGLFYHEAPQIDPWGRPIAKGVSPVLSGPATDAVYRILSPSEVSTKKPFKADVVVNRWNNGEGNKEWRPTLPDLDYHDANHQVHRMNRAQKEQFLRLSGSIAAKLIEMEPLNTEKPTLDDIKTIQTALGDAHARAKRLLAGEKVAGEWKPGEWTGGPPASFGIEQLTQELHEKHIVKQLDALAAKRPGRTGKSALDAEKLAKWEADRAEAKTWLKAARVDLPTAQRVYFQHRAKQIKTPQLRNESIRRMSAGLTAAT